ncbi:uncharacterized protein LOC135705356 [Ochlerotatus camptorhynchus]|uniref:uncharacterized protein LOC135705356 n=1 Tax=Ochlerotatus camptorhynchus TaxID=644619 RepID=UPI0031D1E9FB
MNRNFMVNCPRTPAPVRNSSFLTSAAAVLETPTLLRKPASSSTNNNENVASSTPTLQPPSAASTAAMQFLMFNQMQSAAFTNSSNGGTPFLRNVANKNGVINSTSGFNFAIPNIPDSTTTVATRIIENLQISSSDASLKRKHEDGYGNSKIHAKRVQFEPLPLKPRNQVNGNRWSSKTAFPALTSGPSKQTSPPSKSTNSDVKKLRILTGSVEHIMKLSKTSPGGSPLVEVFANVLTIKAGAYECEKILLLRNRTGPVMQGVFYEIDFHMPAVSVGDLVRCVGRLTGGSRLQILKITLATPEEDRMGQRLQTVSGFVVSVKR